MSLPVGSPADRPWLDFPVNEMTPGSERAPGFFTGPFCCEDRIMLVRRLVDWELKLEEDGSGN